MMAQFNGPSMEAANEELPTNNVIHMGDFLLRKHIKLQASRDSVYENAKRIQKKGFTEKDDPFAAPLYTKAERMDEELDRIAAHIRFIMRGGHGAKIPTMGYSLQHPRVPPPARITLTQTQ